MDGLKLLTTGVPNLDEIFGGGIPLYSVNIVAGEAGSGKTILTQQMLFHNASPDSKCLYFTTLSEPAFKLIRYQQSFDFFDVEKLNESVFHIDIGGVVRERGLNNAIGEISKHVEEHSPACIAIDSFKAIRDIARDPIELRRFGYDLAVSLSAWMCTSFLVGEYSEDDVLTDPIFAIVDGIFYVTNQKQSMQNVRLLNVRKLRGMDIFTGDHPFSISQKGIHVHPRIKTPSTPVTYEISSERVAFGVAGLDEMLMGGFPRGTATLIAGGAGTGKTMLGLHFAMEGVRNGEPAVFVSFQESPSQLAAFASARRWDLEEATKANKLRMLYSSPVELGVDQHASVIKDVVAEVGAKRVVIDGLNDLEAATQDKTRYKDYVYSLVNFFKARGVSCVMTSEIPDLFGSMSLAGHGISFVADNVIMLRYAEIASAVTRAISVLKVRGCDHDKALREYEITSGGVRVLEPFEGVEGVLSGQPTITRAVRYGFEDLLGKMSRAEAAAEGPDEELEPAGAGSSRGRSRSRRSRS